jgi:hypothetical protein
MLSAGEDPTAGLDRAEMLRAVDPTFGDGIAHISQGNSLEKGESR